MKSLSEKAKRIVDAPNVACVATIMPDGSPQVAPVWIDREGDLLIINSTETARRVKNLKRNPRIALCVFDLKDTHSKIVVRGVVREITKDSAEEHVDKLEMKYRGNSRFPRHDPQRPRVIIRIEAEHLSE